MKIERTKEEEKIWINEIPVGTVFDCDLSGLGYGGPFLRTYDQVVSLSRPQHVWTVGAPGSTERHFQVAGFRPLKAKLVVED